MAEESRPASAFSFICEGPEGVIEVFCSVEPRGSGVVVQPIDHEVLSGRPPLVSTARLHAAYYQHKGR